MNVYFARSLRGDRTGGDQKLYEEIGKTIRTAGCQTQFEIREEFPRTLEETYDQHVYRRDLYWIRRCQAMVAEVSDASHGVGYEIAYAKHVCNIPIFCCALKDTPVSAMITGDIEVCYYRDLSDLPAFIEAFLEGVADNEH